MNKIAFITGATAGIGKATAIKLASQNWDIIITGRRNELLSSLETELTNNFKVNVLALNFDVRDRFQVNNAINSLSGKWQKIDLLINNAGLASGLEPFDQGNFDDWDKMIDTNIKGLINITKAIVNLMIPYHEGQIINISSIAGKEAYSSGSVYCATKHAVEALTKSMRLDFLKHNIKVGSIAPGMVETEFSIVRFHGDEQKAKNVYTGMTPLSAEDIAEAIFFMVSRPAHVNIDDMLIMPTAQGLTRDVIRKQ